MNAKLIVVALSGLLGIAPVLRAADPAPPTPTHADAPAPAASDQSDKSSEDDLAKKILNPVADLISVPFQYNMDFNIGPNNAKRQILNIQPVIPITLNTDWNLIVRTIVPLIQLDSVAPGVDSMKGLGDITQSFFLSPKKSQDGWILGVGPVFLWPSGTDGLSGR